MSSLDVPSPGYEFQLSSLPHAALSFDQQDMFSRRKSIPRSAGLSSHGSLQSRQTFPMAPQSILPSQGVQQQRTLSHQTMSSHQMHRTASNMSTQSASPFMCSGPVTPPPKSIPAAQHYMSSNESAAAYMAAMHASPARPRARTAMSMNAGLTTVAESKLLDPETYFANLEGLQDAANASYLSTSLPGQMRLSDMPSQWHPSSVSVCGSMTTGLTPDTAPMTRENSSLFDSQSVGGAMHMMQLGSHQGTDQSHLGSPRYAVTSSGQNSPLSKHNSPADEDLNGVGSSLVQPYLSSYGHSTTAEDGPVSQAMSRSASNASAVSTKSASSLRYRAKETLHRQNRNIATLKPKPAAEQKSTDGNSGKKDGKAVITKAKYVRPRQPKVFCEKCSDHPEGFRGEHELRRHRDAKHPEHGMVRKWVCVDPATRNLPVGVAVVNPLDKCKACKAAKKYGAYYNAAAHLRRTHFKEKPSRAKKGGNGASRSDDDKRGGKGGGDWPPMAELKNWMKEIWVNKDDSKVDSDEDNDEDNGVEHSSGDMEVDLDNNMNQMPVEYPMAQHTPGGIVSDITFSNMYPAQLGMNHGMVPLYSSQQLISSAGFTEYPGSPMGHAYPWNGHMPQYGSVVSSNDTITPSMANYGETMSNVGDIHYDGMMYSQ
ncbi:hypothetical protein PFICI_08412 [Pestalotiopsis fici W106-1]|uniref:DUF7896 domain-containing protein n=1 Tax=Pestalotiopsis fici (strain W106-1 / CGMCC3.15140) TaxID=1229662 RepID=W3X417_PESFW|nr:uncharacterized protein PFICI_08412 [Pestalotiopsis fici W106-1]ETS80883.1 hypothetical protein PFICI_08412 [Pestalotiopsis fici W106-1]